MMKRCEWCETELVPMPNEQGRPKRFQARRFCNHSCAAQWRGREHRRLLTCRTCRKEFYAAANQESRAYCSNACYLVAHASEQKTCQHCGANFVPSGYQKGAKYCSPACSHAANKGKPRRPFARLPQSAEQRMKISVSRLGEKNPNWTGGRRAGQYRFQTALFRWGLANLGGRCAECGKEEATVHHILPRRLFEEIPMAHFSQNLIVLCRSCHASFEHISRRAQKAKRVTDIPFSSRLPQPILSQLETDGLVSRLVRECDFSPLGTVAEVAILPEWYYETS